MTTCQAQIDVLITNGYKNRNKENWVFVTVLFSQSVYRLSMEQWIEFTNFNLEKIVRLETGISSQLLIKIQETCGTKC